MSTPIIAGLSTPASQAGFQAFWPQIARGLVALPSAIPGANRERRRCDASACWQMAMLMAWMTFTVLTMLVPTTALAQTIGGDPVALGHFPGRMAVNPRTNRTYVANFPGDSHPRPQNGENAPRELARLTCMVPSAASSRRESVLPFCPQK